MTIKTIKLYLYPVIFFLLSLTIFSCKATAEPVEQPSKQYGVFLGLNGDEADKMKDYTIVAIEPSEFSKEQITALHAAGKFVYGYINVGALETYRDYYDTYKHLSLGVYENWEDERWINVASPEWHTFIDGLARDYVALGLDGFFVDNADVYYHYKTDDIFAGLCTITQGLKILKSLKNEGVKVLINGGDDFVSRCIEESKALQCFDGVNQETVFTSIDFGNNTYGEQEPSETTYFQNYLATVKAAGLSVFLLEYAAKPTLAQKIESYCNQNGFLWYNARDKELR